MGKSSSGILALNRNNGRNRTSVLPDFLLKTICPTETSWLAAWIKISELENPVQKKKSKNEPEDNSAGPEENIDDSSQQQLDVACQSNSSCTVCKEGTDVQAKMAELATSAIKNTGFCCFLQKWETRDPLHKSVCVKCIWNRYGDKVEVAHPLNNWRCPSCRGICNCGRCMKERGFQPAGIRGRVGKTIRFPSVMERLVANSSKNINEVVDRKETSATEESVPGSDGRKDAGSSNSMEVHLSSELNSTVGMEEEKSERRVLSVMLSPSRADYESLLNHLTQFEQRNIGIMQPGRAII